MARSSGRLVYDVCAMHEHVDPGARVTPARTPATFMKDSFFVGM